MHNHLETLCQGRSLDRAQSEELFGSMVNGGLTEPMMAAVLTALKIKGETSDEIAGAALALRRAARPFPRPAGQVADIVGTGGDGAHSINISSTSVFVAAAAGVRVCKHGNRSVSSRSGSAEVLKELGINIEMTPEQAVRVLEQTNASFVFAPQYHPGVRHAMPVRQALKTRTLFNILGPLINPAHPDVMLIGVYSRDLLVPVARVLPSLGVTRAMVVHGDGMDEICLHGPTDVVEVEHGQITQYQMTPEMLGLKRASKSELAGGEPAENARISREILAGKGKRAHAHAVAANAGCLIYLSGKAETPARGVQMALDIIGKGVALSTLDSMSEMGHG